jgi:hypothetical protein
MSSREEDLLQRIAQLEMRVGLLEDIEAIKRLQRMYGYYIDNRLWDEMTELFADDGVIEIGQRGSYQGKENIRVFLREVLGQGRTGLNHNEFINHMQLQGVVTVDPDRQHAKGRWRALIQGSPPPGGTTMLWAEGVYENHYVNQDGQWKIARLWWVPTFYVSHPGYESVSFASAPASNTIAPQAPSASPLDTLGRAFVPFHYRHPITDESVIHISSADQAAVSAA